VGHRAEDVKEALSGYTVTFVDQGEPRGTGHAVLMTESALKGFQGNVFILNGDVPLISDETLRSMGNVHEKGRCDLTLLSVEFNDPGGYGRIIRGEDGGVRGIVEESDASAKEKKIREVNTGFYLVAAPFLFEVLKEIGSENSQQEYYLTDIVRLALEKGRSVSVFKTEDVMEVAGVNNRVDLAVLENHFFRKIAEKHMNAGVTIHDPDSVRIDAGVEIGRDTEIHSQVRLEGKTRIGEDCVIRSFSRISNCRLSDGITVRDSCVLAESDIGDGVTIGPFAHLRPGTRLSKKSSIGNFVEVKNTEVGEESKANHLTYLGDAEIGRGVNIGAGTITCNYDGVRKSRTIIEDQVFIGSDTQLVAPVKVGKGAVVGAGSTITEDVSGDSLALSRSPQTSKKGWAGKRRKAAEKKREKKK
ncbi:MAG TPA: bifunctional UDP-N-acetylglucosamine diphosphorylase/glucosamine-1-phosphate N-acetyltransferase GlmU, partial [Nitrospiria bacterium]